MCLISTPSLEPCPVDFPDADELAVPRAWSANIPVRKAAKGYATDRIEPGQSARGLLDELRSRLAKFAREIGRQDLGAAFEHVEGERSREAKTVADTIEVPRYANPQTPQASEVDRIKTVIVALINLSIRRLDEVQCRLGLAQQGCRDAK